MTVWERQPRETPKAWAAFCLYRDLPPGERSLARVASELVDQHQVNGKPTTVRRNLATWSARYDWARRAAAWDQERDRVRREAQLETVAATAQRHAQIAAAALDAAIRPSMSLAARLKRDPGELDEPAVAEHARVAAQLARAVPALIEAERLSRGVATQRVELAGAAPVDDGLADEEHLMRVFAALAEAGYAPLPPGGEER